MAVVEVCLEVFYIYLQKSYQIQYNQCLQNITILQFSMALQNFMQFPIKGPTFIKVSFMLKA